MDTDAATNPDEHELLRCARNGDGEAFGRLVASHEPELHRLTLRITGHEADAADIVQETLMRAYSSLRSFDGRSSLRTWLTRIAINAALNHRGRESLREKTSAGWAESVGGAGSGGAQPFAELAGREEHEVLHRALSQLSAMHRTVLVLQVWEGLSYAQIAEVVGCRMGTVMSRLHNAKRAMRANLEQLMRNEP